MTELVEADNSVSEFLNSDLLGDGQWDKQVVGVYYQREIKKNRDELKKLYKSVLRAFNILKKKTDKEYLSRSKKKQKTIKRNQNIINEIAGDGYIRKLDQLKANVNALARKIHKDRWVKSATKSQIQQQFNDKARLEKWLREENVEFSTKSHFQSWIRDKFVPEMYKFNLAPEELSKNFFKQNSMLLNKITFGQLMRRVEHFYDRKPKSKPKPPKRTGFQKDTARMERLKRRIGALNTPEAVRGFVQAEKIASKEIWADADYEVAVRFLDKTASNKIIKLKQEAVTHFGNQGKLFDNAHYRLNSHHAGNDESRAIQNDRKTLLNQERNAFEYLQKHGQKPNRDHAEQMLIDSIQERVDLFDAFEKQVHKIRPLGNNLFEFMESIDQTDLNVIHSKLTKIKTPKDEDLKNYRHFFARVYRIYQDSQRIFVQAIANSKNPDHLKHIKKNKEFQEKIQKLIFQLKEMKVSHSPDYFKQFIDFLEKDTANLTPQITPSTAMLQALSEINSPVKSLAGEINELTEYVKTNSPLSSPASSPFSSPAKKKRPLRQSLYHEEPTRMLMPPEPKYVPKKKEKLIFKTFHQKKISQMRKREKIGKMKESKISNIVPRGLIAKSIKLKKITAQKKLENQQLKKKQKPQPQIKPIPEEKAAEMVPLPKTTFEKPIFLPDKYIPKPKPSKLNKMQIIKPPPSIAPSIPPSIGEPASTTGFTYAPPSSIIPAVALPPPAPQQIQYLKSLIPHYHPPMVLKPIQQSEFTKAHIRAVREFNPHLKIVNSEDRHGIGQHIDIHISPHRFEFIVHPGVGRLAIQEMIDKINFHLRSLSKKVNIYLLLAGKGSRHRMILSSKQLRSGPKKVERQIRKYVSEKIRTVKHLVLHQTNTTGGALYSRTIHNPMFKGYFR